MSRRSLKRPPARGVFYPPSPRAARQLDHTARRRNMHSATSLISTVPDDTNFRRVAKMRQFRSPNLAVRSTFRASRLWGQDLTPRHIPKRALVCAKRTIRREVLFAQRQTGRGSKAPRRVYTNDSKEKCK